MLHLSSPAFADGGPIPRAHTCDGADLSPPLVWSGLPEGTQSLALIVDDPDAPRGTFVHWVLYGLPPTAASLPAGLPKDPETQKPVPCRQGTNGFRRIGYGGPCPPPGPAHRYVFRLYALGEALSVPPGATKDVLLKALEGKVVGDAEMTGKYGRS